MQAPSAGAAECAKLRCGIGGAGVPAARSLKGSRLPAPLRFLAALATGVACLSAACRLPLAAYRSHLIHASDAHARGERRSRQRGNAATRQRGNAAAAAAARQPAESPAMTGRRLALLALAFAAALGGAARAATPPDGTGASQPCRLGGLPHEVRCGVLARPLDPARPDGPHIDLHYVVVPATALHKREDPVFFLAGGPGQSAIALAPRVMPWFARLARRRDVVFIDQRGTGRSAPLECERDDALPLAERIDVDRAIARLRDCRRRLEALPHGDLRQYTTSIAMADADAVRAALGAPRVNLVGGSYGTRSALEYLRQFPQRVP